MRTGTKWAGAGMMLIAAAIFGMNVARFAHTSLHVFSTVALYQLGGGLAVLAYAAFRGGLRRIPWKLALVASLFNVAQVSLYMVAVRIAPIGPAAAIKLSTPVLLLAYAIVHRERSATFRDFAVGALAILGAVSATSGAGAVNEGGLEVWGYALAVLSAGCAAGMFESMARVGNGPNLMTFIGVFILLPGVVLSPALFLNPGSVEESIQVFATGVLVGAPAVVLLFAAMRRLTTVLIGSLALAEAPSSALFGFVLYGQPLLPPHLAAMGFIIGAAVLEITRPPGARRAAPVSPALPVEARLTG